MGTVPKAVSNLRRIWETKKDHLEVTQAQAAKKLGWTQGAFSQYLNNITDLHSDAVAKLANFLEVDPHEIDPEFSPIEATRFKVPILYIHPKTPANHSEFTYRRRVVATVAEENYNAICAIKLEKDLRPIGYKGQMTLCSNMFKLKTPRLTPSRVPEFYIIKRKNSDPLEVIKISECPPDKELEAKLLPLLTYIIN